LEHVIDSLTGQYSNRNVKNNKRSEVKVYENEDEEDQYHFENDGGEDEYH